MSEKDSARKSFDLRLGAARANIKTEYDQLLIDFQIEGAKGNNGRPITVTVEDRERLLAEAERNVIYGHVDPDKMASDWEAATTKEGRPPIGGAQDN